MECVGDIDLQSVRSSTYQEMCGRGKYKTACLPSCPAFERTHCDCWCRPSTKTYSISTITSQHNLSFVRFQFQAECEDLSVVLSMECCQMVINFFVHHWRQYILKALLMFYATVSFKIILTQHILSVQICERFIKCNASSNSGSSFETQNIILD